MCRRGTAEHSSRTNRCLWTLATSTCWLLSRSFCSEHRKRARTDRCLELRDTCWADPRPRLERSLCVPWRSSKTWPFRRPKQSPCCQQSQRSRTASLETSWDRRRLPCVREESCGSTRSPCQRPNFRLYRRCSQFPPPAWDAKQKSRFRRRKRPSIHRMATSERSWLLSDASSGQRRDPALCNHRRLRRTRRGRENLEGILFWVIRCRWSKCLQTWSTAGQSQKLVRSFVLGLEVDWQHWISVMPAYLGDFNFHSRHSQKFSFKTWSLGSELINGGKRRLWVFKKNRSLLYTKVS